MKSLMGRNGRILRRSPSTRREWIEMLKKDDVTQSYTGLPPHGGSGLKFPSYLRYLYAVNVSLHTEGVD